jgi:YD repeat-containing protein
LSTEGFAYEPGGQVALATNALGAVTETQYTSAGKPKYRKNADGSTNAWRYYLDGRVQKEILQNGNLWESVYDDANRKVTRTFKNASSSLATTTTEFDRRGNAIRTTDVENNVFTNRYDGLDRIKQAFGPALITVGFDMGFNPVTNVTQQVTTYTYDASGQVLTVANALGEKTVSTSDALGRPVVVEIKGSNGVNVRVTQTVYATNHHSVTIWQGTGTNAIATTTWTDNDGQPVLIVNYPINNVWEYILRRYDVAGNRIQRHELSRTGSQTTTWATNAWMYDGLNRPITETVRDGATTTFGYNALGNMTNRAMPNGLTWAATYNSAGNILTEQDSGSGQTARTNSYQYYSAGHQWAGKLQAATDARGISRTSTYDDYMRLATVITGGSAPEHTITNRYEYDRRNLLKVLSQASGSTNQPETAVRRSYDDYGYLKTEIVSIGANYSQSNFPVSRIAVQSWNQAGRREGLVAYPSYTFSSLQFGYQADGQLTNVIHSPSFTAGFAYADNGLLTRRSNLGRTWQVNNRDGRGRLLKATTTAGVSTAMTETLTWQGDGRLATYSMARSDFTDTRTYTYSPLSQ